MTPTPQNRKQSRKKKDNENKKIEELRNLQKEELKTLSLWKSPIKTGYYFFFGVIPQYYKQFSSFLVTHKVYVYLFLLSMASFAFFVLVENPLQPISLKIWNIVKIAAFWIFLGILSSVGLGTGLHTFVLYLGPFIASTTLAATECKTTNFESYGPNRFTCTTTGTKTPSFFEIWSLVAFEAFMWGTGTAIGELPPYFVARAARLAGERIKDIDESESDSDNDVNGNEESKKRKRKKSLFDKAKQTVISWLGRIGFIGILLFASIPNPLFDLAGLTCGHMLVPFTTFFLACFIGKAVIKVTLQTVFVITVFDKDLLAKVVAWIDSNIPFASGRAQKMFDNVRKQYHRQPGEAIEKAKGGFSIFVLWDIVLIVMISYFVISIINSSVRDYVTKMYEKEIDELEKKMMKKESSKSY